MKKIVSCFITFMLVLSLLFMYSDDTYAAGKKKYVKSVTVTKSITVNQSKTQNVKVKINVVNKASKDLVISVKNRSIVSVKYLKHKGILQVKGLKAGKTKVTITTKARNAKGKKIKKSFIVKVKANNVSLRSDVKSFRNMTYGTVKNKYGASAYLEGGGRFYVRIPNKNYELYIVDYSNELKNSDKVEAVVGKFGDLFTNTSSVNSISQLSKALNATSVEKIKGWGSPYAFSDGYWYEIKFKNSGVTYKLSICVSSESSTSINSQSWSRISF